MTGKLLILASAVAAGLLPLAAQAQTDTSLAAIRGLAPVEALPNTEPGHAALGANYTETLDIQTGQSGFPLLMPFPAAEQQALRDAFITRGNLAALADGLGSSLGAAYEARAHYANPSAFTNLSPAIAAVIRYSQKLTQANAKAAKFFFANATQNGTDAASSAATSLLRDMNAKPDIFGRAYDHPAGSPGAGQFGNARPFQTIPGLISFSGRDYFNRLASSTVYTRGPGNDLTDSPSFPSGHTTYAFTGALVLAMLVPERYPQLMARAAEYGNGRILIGAHYAMDVIAGRTLATYDMAHLLANDSAYLSQSSKGEPPMRDFAAAVATARGDATRLLSLGCGDTIAVCGAADHGRFNDIGADRLFYEATLGYGLPVVFSKTAQGLENVSQIAPEAGYLLTVAYPSLSLAQADQILTETEAPGGGFLDNGTEFGLYSRLDLFAASQQAQALAAQDITAKGAMAAPANAAAGSAVSPKAAANAAARGTPTPKP